MTSSYLMIELILNRNFGNTFQYKNGPNQHQPTHKNTSQQHQHRNTSQRYQPRSFQRPRTSSIPYLKEDCIGCGLNNKGVRCFLIQLDGKLYFCPFIGPLFIRKSSQRIAPSEQSQKWIATKLLQ